MTTVSDIYSDVSRRFNAADNSRSDRVDGFISADEARAYGLLYADFDRDGYMTESEALKAVDGPKDPFDVADYDPYLPVWGDSNPLPQADKAEVMQAILALNSLSADGDVNMQALGVIDSQVSREEADRFNFGWVDGDNNGFMSREEYESADAFDRADGLNGKHVDGLISRDEAEQANVVGTPIKVEEPGGSSFYAPPLFSDTDGDQYMSREEYENAKTPSP